MDHTHILIVDDEAPIQRMLSRVLQQHGYHTTSASNAAEARIRLTHGAYSLLLCDVQMPGESGLDLVKHVFAQYPHTASVMVTGVDNPSFAHTALEAGAYGYVLKPFESNEIVITVANALRRRRLEMENRIHREQLERTVDDRTAALRHAVESLESIQRELRYSREETIRRLPSPQNTAMRQPRNISNG